MGCSDLVRGVLGTVRVSTLARLPALAPITTLFGKFLSRQQDLPVVFLGALKLHHHRDALLVNVLQQICQRVLQRVQLSGQHQVTLVQLELELGYSLRLLFPSRFGLELDVLHGYHLLFHGFKDHLPLFFLEADLCHCRINVCF